MNLKRQTGFPQEVGNMLCFEFMAIYFSTRPRLSTLFFKLLDHSDIYRYFSRLKYLYGVCIKIKRVTGYMCI